jgi:hypothetical protein
MKKAAVLAFALISSSAFAEVGWKDADGKTAPDTEWQKSVDGFGGVLVITSDRDWEKKWKSTPDVVPQFNGSSIVKTGGELFILTMFTNPQLDEKGKANVTVDIDLKRPNGSASTHAEGAVCFQGTLGESPLNVFRCGPVIGFVAESSDPVGTWSVRITLTDTARKVSIPLAATFALLKEEQSSR